MMSLACKKTDVIKCIIYYVGDSERLIYTMDKILYFGWYISWIARHVLKRLRYKLFIVAFTNGKVPSS